jgi:hypothetical protein
MTGGTVITRVQTAAAAATYLVPSRRHALADPPAGSGLEPLPGEQGPPLIGHTFSTLYDLLGLARRQYERFGPVSWVGGFAI